MIHSIRLYVHRDGKFYGLSISQLGFVPHNKGLYRLALLHKSASKKAANGVLLNYERLEFLGDAVLGAIVAELLYKFFPNQDEGFLTRVRSKIVSRESLNELAINIGLDKAVVAKSDISHNKHIYGDVFEAFIGAIFLDQGFANTKRFIEKFIFPNFFDIKNLVSVDTNYKSQLIEWGQKYKKDISFLKACLTESVRLVRIAVSFQSRYLFEPLRQRFSLFQPYLFISSSTYNLLNNVLQIEDLHAMRDYLSTARSSPLHYA